MKKCLKLFGSRAVINNGKLTVFCDKKNSVGLVYCDKYNTVKFKGYFDDIDCLGAVKIATIITNRLLNVLDDDFILCYKEEYISSLSGRNVIESIGMIKNPYPNNKDIKNIRIDVDTNSKVINVVLQNGRYERLGGIWYGETDGDYDTLNDLLKNYVNNTVYYPARMFEKECFKRSEL